MSFAPAFFPSARSTAGVRPAQSARWNRFSVFLCVLSLTACLAPGALFAQSPGTQDTSFVSGVTGATIYAVADEEINDQQLFIVGGDFQELDRLLYDGPIDPDFKLLNLGSAGRIVYTIVPQILVNDLDRDKTLIGGLFGQTPATTSNGQPSPAQNVQRLNSDGLLDTTFNPGFGANNYVTAIVPEANGSIYVGGLFDHFNHIAHSHVVRLNVDGSVDDTFSSGLNILDAVLSLSDQIDPGTGLANGQILLAGTFNRVDGTNTAKVARLNNDGSLDRTFKPIIDTRVLTILGLPDGKILIGGSFSSVDGKPVQNIARLNHDGSLDTSFKASIGTNPPGSPDPTAVYILKLLSDGRIYAGGNFFGANGETREYLARFMPNGTLDGTFNPGSAIINSVQSLAIQQNNEVLVGETVSRKINNVFPESLIRLFSDNPPLPPVITITAAKPSAVESDATGNPRNGRFVLTRTGGDLNEGLTVEVAVGGTAVQGMDYKHLSLGPNSTKSFDANVGTAVVGVRPLGKPLRVSPETVTLTLEPAPNGGNPYVLGGQTSATVTLSNH